MDDLERLSRFRAGELDRDEAEALEARLSTNTELRRALTRLDRLERLTGTTGHRLALTPSDEALIARLATAPARRNCWVPALMAAGIAALVVVAAAVAVRQSETPVIGPEPIADAPGPGITPAAKPLRMALPHGDIAATPTSDLKVTPDGRVVLLSGTALLRSTREVTVILASHELLVEGEALLTTEGERALQAAAEAGGVEATQRLASYSAVISRWRDTTAATLPLTGSVRVDQGHRLSAGSPWSTPVASAQVALSAEPQRGEGAASLEDTSGQPGDAGASRNDGAPVEVIAFSDFECSYCLRAFSILRDLRDRYGEDIRITIRHRPLPMHVHARRTAAASIAAEEQGKFWEYVELLVTNPGAHGPESLEQYARQLRLDLDEFREAMKTPRVSSRIDADLAEAARLGVNQVPEFFIDGRAVVGAQGLEDYQRLIDEALAR